MGAYATLWYVLWQYSSNAKYINVKVKQTWSIILVALTLYCLPAVIRDLFRVVCPKCVIGCLFYVYAITQHAEVYF